MRTLAALAAALMMTTSGLAAPTELRVALPVEPASLDVSTDASAATAQVSFGNIFEPLMRLDPSGEAEPWLAERWELAPDGLSLMLTLRDGVRFHDGTSFDADDAAFTFGRLIGAHPDFSGLSAAAIVDPRTLRLVLAKADPQLVEKLARVVMVAPESAGNNARAPIGTGPFALFDWFEGDRVLFERNEDYWGTHPKLVRAAMVFIPDPATAVAALEAGTVDVYAQVPDPEILAPLRTDSRFVVGADAAWKAGIEGMPETAAPDRMELVGLAWAQN